MNNQTRNPASLLREGLERRAQTLDGTTLGRLRAGRRAALVMLEQSHRPGLFVPSNWFPVSLAAATALLVGWLLLPVQTAVSDPEPLNDATILAYDEGLDLYEEIEFYDWLDMESS